MKPDLTEIYATEPKDGTVFSRSFLNELLLFLHGAKID
jgi:hypothetical protein